MPFRPSLTITAVLISLIVAATGRLQGEVAQPRATLSGHIQNQAGAPIEAATVYIFSAAPKTGTSSFCPTCYADCAKTARSDVRGDFKISGLSPELVFRIIFMAKGYRPQSLDDFDPARNAIVILDALLLDSIPGDQVLRGRVVDSVGGPIRGAIVEAQGMFNREGVGHRGELPGVDRLAVSDDAGEFVITSREPFSRMDVRLYARGCANRTVTRLKNGIQSQPLVMSEGTCLSGRVLVDGRPLPNVSLGVVDVHREAESYAGHFETDTDSGGYFSFFNLPPKVEYYIYGLMESMGKYGSIRLQKVRVGADGETTKVGDLMVGPAHRINGRVVLADGENLRPHTRLLLDCGNAWDSLQVELEEDGSFDIQGVPSETIGLSVNVRGYRTSAKNRSFDVLNGTGLAGRVDTDIIGLKLLLEKGDIVRPNYSRSFTDAEEAALPQYHPLHGVEDL